MNAHVLLAVFRRNFVSYFASPTGYVFICLFVLLGAIAAFWVPDFFNNNLANLDQLSYWFPFIMLIYIPTITMGVWADERRQGTDELLLTIPAGDFDIVLGKYMAAVATYSVALLFSLVCNYVVLWWLSCPDLFAGVKSDPAAGLNFGPDAGLFLSTYVGYWLIGLAMLAIGMVASFLTGNLTIGFVLGVLLNMPLVFLAWVDAVFGAFSQQTALAIKQWSIARQFSDFGRGVLNLSGLAYFVLIVAVMLYASMVLIGRRHWFSGVRRWGMAVHYGLRILCLAVVAAAAVVVLADHDARWDISQERLSSLSPKTCELIRSLRSAKPVQIDAFISPVVPETYVQTRLNLLSVLREFQSLGGKYLQVRIHDTERYSEEEAFAKQRYGIEPRQVVTRNHGAVSEDSIFLYVVVRSGSAKPIPPLFIDRGVPIEYELIRSICTLAQEKRKKLGVLTTDIPLYGGISFQGMMPSATNNWPIIDELEKQYDVVRIDPSKPITEKVDVLFAVEPSTLGPREMDNFIAAIESGVPTAIFEDPAVISAAQGGSIPGTSVPRQAGGGMMMRQQQLPQGDIRKLWRLLGVTFAGSQIIWQDYNPYRKVAYLSKDRELVFVDAGCGNRRPFNPKDPVSAGMQQVLFLFPGAIVGLNSSELTFTPLATTGDKTGLVEYNELLSTSPFGQRSLNPKRRRISTGVEYVMAARIHGKISIPDADAAEETIADKKDAKKSEKPKTRQANINVILVADVDMLSDSIFRIREQGDVPEAGVFFDFDNVPFILNALDSLAGDDRFLEIRKRRPKHRTLTRVDKHTAAAEKKILDTTEQFYKEQDAVAQKAERELQEKLAELRNRPDIDQQRMLTELKLKLEDLQRRNSAKIERLRQEHEQKIQKSQAKLARDVRLVQSQYKLWAVLLPPILPLVVAIFVFFTRRAREREGVSRSRLR